MGKESGINSRMLTRNRNVNLRVSGRKDKIEEKNHQAKSERIIHILNVDFTNKETNVEKSM